MAMQHADAELRELARLDDAALSQIKLPNSLVREAERYKASVQALSVHR
jgi:hypothetical protein